MVTYDWFDSTVADVLATKGRTFQWKPVENSALVFVLIVAFPISIVFIEAIGDLWPLWVVLFIGWAYLIAAVSFWGIFVIAIAAGLLTECVKHFETTEGKN